MVKNLVYLGDKYYWASNTFMSGLAIKESFKSFRDLKFINWGRVQNLIKEGWTITIKPATLEQRNLADKYLQEVKTRWNELKKDVE